jgi:alpha-L-fucosidase
MSKHTRSLAALAIVVLGGAAFGQPVPRPPSAVQRARRAWFGEAKFGLLIQWGLYAAPAGEWKGQLIPGPGEWIMRNARIPLKEYEQLASSFRPTQFDAEAWAKMAEEAGAKYVVVTAKDRDGFAMYRSASSRFNIFDATPFHRDPLKELAAACVRHHLKFGVSYSRSEDWHEPNGGGNDWDFAPGAPKDFDQYLQAKAESQVKELLKGYGAVSLLRFDAGERLADAQPRRFNELAHSLQPGTMVMGSPSDGGDYLSFETDRVPQTVTKGDWEVHATINPTGGFKRFDNNWQSTDEIIFQLVDTVSKGGNYLLGIGPTAEGVIPRPSLSTLETMGEWLKLYGEAIYGAGPTPFGDELGPRRAWRCTTKPGKLFVTLFQWPDSPLELNHVAAKVTKAYLMADESHAPLKVTQSGARVSVALPNDPPFEGEIPERMNPKFVIASLREHTHTVVVLETKP